MCLKIVFAITLQWKSHITSCVFTYLIDNKNVENGTNPI